MTHEPPQPQPYLPPPPPATSHSSSHLTQAHTSHSLDSSPNTRPSPHHASMTRLRCTTHASYSAHSTPQVHSTPLHCTSHHMYSSRQLPCMRLKSGGGGETPHKAFPPSYLPTQKRRCNFIGPPPLPKKGGRSISVLTRAHVTK